MRVIITRPEPECGRWVEAMKQQGLSAVALPLIEISSMPFALNVSKNYDAFMFVSRNAVEGFFKSQTMDALKDTRCLVTGPGTRAALIQQGLQVDLIDVPDSASGQFDSEALWQVVGKSDWQSKRVLVVRGANHLGEQEGRPWLADQLTHAGAIVDFVVTYERRLPNLSDTQQLLLQTKQDVACRDIWLFSSSQAINHLRLLVPSKDWSKIQALATHPRIQITAYGAGFGQVDVVRPVLDDVSEWVKSQMKKR